jgi:hypothetical protein
LRFDDVFGGAEERFDARQYDAVGTSNRLVALSLSVAVKALKLKSQIEESSQPRPSWHRSYAGDWRRVDQVAW